MASIQGYSFSVGMLLCVWEYLLNNYLDIGQLKSDGFFTFGSFWRGGIDVVRSVIVCICMAS